MLNPGCTLLAALGAALVLPALPASATVADPPPTGGSIQIMSIGGSDCPFKSGSVALSYDGQSFTISGGEMRVEVGGPSGPTVAQRSCQLNLVVRAPQGYAYAIKPAEYYGYAHLEAGVSGVLTSSGYFQGDSNPQSRTFRLNGPLSRNWRAQVSEPDPAPRPCGEQRYYNISTELRVDLGTSDPSKISYMAKDGKETYQFVWKKCSTA